MAKCFVLDVVNNETRTAECEDLSDFYRELGCDCFDITRLAIGDDTFDIFCDDIGWLRERPVVSAICAEGAFYKPVLAGNLVIARHDAAGETISLSDEDIEMINAFIVKLDSPLEYAGKLVLLCKN